MNDEQATKEINLSISFGQRLMLYYDTTLKKILSSMIDDNLKIRQHYESDKNYICDIVNSLETGEGVEFLYPIKKRLTIVGQEFFKKEFAALKSL